MRCRSVVHGLLPAVAGLLALMATPSARARADDGAAPPDAPGWPRVMVDQGDTLTVYQPQVDEWTDSVLHARAAVAVQSADARPPVYGVAWLTARTSVDKPAGVVTLDDLEVPRASFPTAPERTAELLEVLRRQAAEATTTMSLERLQADLAIGRAVGRLHREHVRNDPPRMVYATVPTVLVPVDGEPVLRRVDGAALRRVVNTRALLVYDLTDGRYDLALMGRWLEAEDLAGPWSPAEHPPAALDALASKLAGQGTVDLYEGTPGDDDEPPDVLVVTRPTELLQTDGPAQTAPVPGTGLEYVTNSDQDLFVDRATRTHYARVSGRWFAAPDWDGPWAFVPAGRLPGDFARIPADHARAGALASVPGTPQAREALIANSIPQTATIDRHGARFFAVYDGAPRWSAIEGTALAYALNCATPVIRVGPDSFYAVDNGVWFAAGSPDGPWTVADAVPAAIYAIPPSCPIHYVTYVRVYGEDDDDVWVGYTPGYLGTCVSDDGTVVYGTGWSYAPWVGTSWFGRPWSYGWDADFGWTTSDGWWLSFGVGTRPCWRPWWGPSAWTWGGWDRDDERWVLNDCDLYRPPVIRHPRDRRPPPGPWPGFVDRGPRGARPLPPLPVRPADVGAFAAARRPVLRPTPASRPLEEVRPALARPLPRPGDSRVGVATEPRTSDPRPGPARRPGSRPDDVYAGPDGRVYRQAGGGWQTRTRQGWGPVRPTSGGVPGMQARDWRPALERDAEARRVGEVRAQSRRAAARPAPAERGASGRQARSDTPARGRGGHGGRR